jgi:ankyrin repeat protein
MLGMANRSDLSTRVTALLDDSLARGRAGLAVAFGTALAAILAVVAIAPLRAVAFVGPETHVVNDRSDDASVDGSQAGGLSTVNVLRRRPRALDRALYEAAENGDLDEVNELLQAGANINGVVEGDGSPLIGAVRSGELSLVRHLLDRGADVNMPVEGDGSPLIVASQRGALPIVQLLLDRRANPDQLVPGDESALIQASGYGHLEVVKLLVARGANVNLGVWVEERRETVEWRSPLSMARKNRHSAVVQFLESAGARN